MRASPPDPLSGRPVWGSGNDLMPDRLILFSGRANPGLSQRIALQLGLSLGNIEIGSFSDGEIFVQIEENVRGADVFAIQATSMPTNENLMELLIIIDALRRASARRITAVIPYYGYARQDRKTQPRVAITAKLVANLISAAGTDRVLAVDLHAGQIQGFFDIPVDHLYAAPVLLDYFRKKGSKDLVVVSPDAGGVERARAFAKRLKAGLAIIDKRREEVNVAQVMHIVGKVAGHDVLLIDDMIDTASTLTEAAAALRREGARALYAGATHAVLSGPAIKRIEESALDEVVVTDTIPPHPEASACEKIQVLSVAPLLAQAIQNIHEESSVSTLFV